MKFLMTPILMVAALSSHLYANSSDSHIEAGSKCYLSQECVAFDNNKIWVSFGSEWAETNALHSDEGGLYVAAKDLPLGYWKCARCPAVNPPWNFVCYNCGFAK